jgi:SAM-dependent methyltransferase
MVGRSPEQVVSYDAANVAAFYDRLGRAELDRWDRSLGDRVSLVLHTEAVERVVPRGGRVLEIGAGPGRFTEVLHRLGCRIVVADLSATQLACNRELGQARGFAASVEDWRQLDICDLGCFEDESFDAVVVLGGPLSYVFDHAERALGECRRVAKRGGVLAASVMSVWGSAHRFLEQVLAMGAQVNREVIRTGDLSPRTVPGSPHHCHMFRARELRDLLERSQLVDIWLSASSALSTGVPSSLVAPDTEAWHTLLELERIACVEPGYLDAGPHLIATARRAANG